MCALIERVDILPLLSRCKGIVYLGRFVRTLKKRGPNRHNSPGGGGGTWFNFCWVCAAASPNPYPIIVYSVASYRPHVSHFWANIPQIPTCRNLLTPEIPQMCDPIVVTLLAPNENATPL